jgi:hypothetical protein
LTKRAYVGTLAALLAVACATTASAGSKPAPFVWPAPNISHLDSIVEQQSPDYWTGAWLAPETWVRNTTGCPWDVDDHQDSIAWDGYLAAGASASVTLCAVTDGMWSWVWDVKETELRLWSTSPDLVVTVASSHGVTAVLQPLPDTLLRGKPWLYYFCRTDRTPGPYPEIPGTNGGWGIKVEWTVTVANPTRKAAGKNTGIFETARTAGEGYACW